MVCSASCACLLRRACAQDSPSFSSLFADIDATALQGERLETLCAYVSSGPKSGTAPRASERDAWWRAVIGAALGDAKVGALHAVHEEGLELNGRLGELGDVEGCFPTGRAALKAGCSVAALLGGQRFLEASVSVVLPGRCEALPLRVVLCARAAVGDTPYFKERRWTEEVSDGKARNLAYVSIPWRIDVETSAQGALLLKGNEGALAGAIFKADEAINPRGCVEYSRQLYGGDGRPTQMLFGLASGAAFGALPGRARFCVGPVGQDRQPGGVAAAGLEFLERDISYAFIGERHRCFRSGCVLLTCAHEPTAECKAENNGNRNRFAPPPRQGRPGQGAKERRADRRAAQAGGAAPAGGAPGSVGWQTVGGGGSRGIFTVQSANYERAGEMRNGQKRPAGGGDAPPPPVRARIEHNSFGPLASLPPPDDDSLM